MNAVNALIAVGLAAVCAAAPAHALAQTVRELPDFTRLVDDQGNAVSIDVLPFRPRACPSGFARGGWQQGDGERGILRGLWIANRGEIACRIIRSCRRLGLHASAVYSDADTSALHVQLADAAFHIGAAAPAASYLNIERLLDAERVAELVGAPEVLLDAKLILWRGHCSVHGRFKPWHVDKIREDVPGVKVLVHPECIREVVENSDLDGSTSYIIKTVENAPSGSKWAIGTEINLVSRLAKRFPDRLIVSLSGINCLCATMYRIDPPHLLNALENLVEGRVINRVQVDPETKILLAVVHNPDLRGPTPASNELRQEFRAGAAHTRNDNRHRF